MTRTMGMGGRIGIAVVVAVLATCCSKRDGAIDTGSVATANAPLSGVSTSEIAVGVAMDNVGGGAQVAPLGSLATAPTAKGSAAIDLFAELAKLQGKRIGNVLVITPGRKQEASIDRALRHLKAKGVDTRRFTHGRATLSGEQWEVSLFELPKRPQFGGYEFWVNLRANDLTLLDWGQMQ